MSARKTAARYVVIYSAFHVGLAFNFLTPLAYVKIMLSKGAIEQGIVLTQYLGTLKFGVIRTIIRPEYVRHNGEVSSNLKTPMMLICRVSVRDHPS